MSLCLATILPTNAPGTSAGVSSPAPAGPRAVLHRPVALVRSPDGRWLFVGNRQAGSVSVVDTARAEVRNEVAVGGRLADLTLAGAGRLLALDETTGELVLLELHDADVRVGRRLKVGPTPSRVRATPDGRCFVSLRWARQVVVAELAPEPHVVRTIDLPFAPCELLPVRDGSTLIVADAFGGRLAVVDPLAGKVESVRTLHAHNIRGLALDAAGRQLLLTHQALNPLATASLDDIHWGNLLTNHIRGLALDAVLDPAGDPLRAGTLRYLGAADRGAGDPEGLAVGTDGTLAVALGGVDELAVGQAAGDWARITVGHRPTAVVLSPDGRRAYVASTLDDSIAVVDLPSRKVTATVTLGTAANLTAEERGERLFFDARLSHDGWLSCQSCHTDGHTNGLLVDNLTDGSYGTPKRTPSLLGVGETGPWAWNGKMTTLEAQVRQSITSTMRGAAPADDDAVRDLVAYLKTLSPTPSVDRLRGRTDAAAVARGRSVFEQQRCSTCHAPPAYTSHDTYDVGLADEAGLRRFNPPSLRGVSQAGPFFHDGRAATLDDVIAGQRHQLKSELSAAEARDLVHFLRSL